MSDSLSVPWDRRLVGAWSLTAVVVLVHLASGLGQWWLGYEDLWTSLVWDRSVRFRVAVGGQLDLLVDAGEVWRLFTSVLLHGDALHLVVNAVSLVVLGRLLEPWVGRARWLGWFCLGGVGGSVASHLAGLYQSDGASGGAFALLGAAVVVGIRHRSRLDPEARWVYGPVLWGFVGLNLVLTVALPFVDAVGHSAGLGVGILLGALAACPDGTPAPWWRSLGWWLVCLGFALTCLWGFTR